MLDYRLFGHFKGHFEGCCCANLLCIDRFFVEIATACFSFPLTAQLFKRPLHSRQHKCRLRFSTVDLSCNGIHHVRDSAFRLFCLRFTRFHASFLHVFEKDHRLCNGDQYDLDKPWMLTAALNRRSIASWRSCFKIFAMSCQYSKQYCFLPARLLRISALSRTLFSHSCFHGKNVNTRRRFRTLLSTGWIFRLRASKMAFTCLCHISKLRKIAP